MTVAHDLTLLSPDDDGYEEATVLFNRAVRRRPRLVAPCSDAAQVAAAVRYARERGLPLSVRAGGHNFTGHALVHNGLTLDLRPMRGVVVDPAARTADVRPGTLWGEYDAATGAYGLASPGGSISTVGVSGFSLGTGLGWLARWHGLAADSLLQADVVTADGEQVTVDTEHDPDLFWALRGGCGNFGVVTRLRFRLHEVDRVRAGTVFVALDDAPAALRHLEQIAGSAPATLMWTAVLAALPPAPFVPDPVGGRTALLLNLCADPADAAAERWIEDLRRGIRSAGALLDVQPYPTFQSVADASAPPGHCWDVRSEWHRPLDGSAIDALCAAAAAARSPLFEIVLRPLGGAVSERPDDATAFGHRRADRLLEVIAGWSPEDPHEVEHRAWMQSTWAAVARLSAGGPDVNHLGRGESADRVRAAFGRSWDRLRAVKRRVDPGDVFRSTQHVPPA